MLEMENLKQSILILNFFSCSIVEKVNILAYNSAIDNFKNKDYEGYLSFWHMVILHTCSYLEEYDCQLGVLTEVYYQDRVNMVKKICKPFFKSIREWSDLKEYRNEIAHTLRKKGKLVLLNPDHDLHKTPYNVLELLFLRNCILQSQRIIKNEFKEEFKNAIEELSIVKYNKSNKKNLRYDNFHQEYHKIVCQSRAIALTHGQDINYDIEEGWAQV